MSSVTEWETRTGAGPAGEGATRIKAGAQETETQEFGSDAGTRLGDAREMEQSVRGRRESKCWVGELGSRSKYANERTQQIMSDLNLIYKIAQLRWYEEAQVPHVTLSITVFLHFEQNVMLFFRLDALRQSFGINVVKT